MNEFLILIQRTTVLNNYIRINSNDSLAMLIRLIVLFCNIAFWLVILTVAYNLFLMICGIPKNKKADLISQTAVEPKTRFAVLISARNEEIVIPYLIRSLKDMDYPQKLFDIFVIADTVPIKQQQLLRLKVQKFIQEMIRQELPKVML